VANTGQADASAVRVEVAIPLGTQLTEGSLGTRPPGTAPAFHDLTEGVIVWQGGLRAGEQMSLVYTLQLLPPGSPPEMLVQQVRVRLGRQRVAIAELTTQLESE
jgi:hypothetical protein